MEISWACTSWGINGKVIDASYFQKTVILCVLDQPHQFQRDCGALQLVMFVLPTNTTCTAANLFLTESARVSF
jgi:hypothetical protein